MIDFTHQISNFTRYGIFSYQFDEAGNVVLNPQSPVFQQNYLSISLSNINYNDGKIPSFYDTTFTEFTNPLSSSNISATATDVLDQINTLTIQNQQLQTQLDNVIALNQLSDTAANALAVQDIIIALRIQLGQGFSASDFQTDFPYLPIPIEQRDNAP